jgi:hypothetical protein
MPTHAAFEYAVIRVVPRVEREEFINVGVIVFARTMRFLGVRLAVDKARMKAFAPNLDLDSVMTHLDLIPLVAAGGKGSGPIGELSQPERFYWLVAPRSTIIQCSPVHTGLCDDPQAALDHLLETMVLIPREGV